MVLRCFSRRFLIPSRNQNSRSRIKNHNQFLHQTISFLAVNGKQKSNSNFSLFSTSFPTITSSTSNSSSNSNQNHFNFDSNFNPNVQAPIGIEIGQNSGGNLFSPSSSPSTTSSNPSVYPSKSSKSSKPKSTRNSTKRSHQNTSSSSSAKHPLIKNLLREIYSTHEPPSPDRVWNAYLKLFKNQSDANTPSIPQLESEHHKLVLRAISPSVQIDRRKKKDYGVVRELEEKMKRQAEEIRNVMKPDVNSGNRNGNGNGNDSKDVKSLESNLNSEQKEPESSSSSSSFLSNYKPSRNHSSFTPVNYSNSEIGIYMQRVQFILSQMRLFTKENLSLESDSKGFFSKSNPVSNLSTSSSPNLNIPDITDYNHIMSILSKTDDLSSLLSIWNQLDGNEVGSRNLEKEKSNKSGNENRNNLLKPTKETYHHFLTCSYKHQSSKIKSLNFNQHQERVKSLVDSKGEGMSSKSLLKKEIKKEQEILGSGFQNQELIRSNRINSERVLWILNEMKNDQDVEINSFTLDLILRNFRISDDLKNFKIVLKDYFNIDLENLDESLVSSPSDEKMDDENSLSKNQFFKPTIHTYNTILMILGEKSTISELISTFETLFNPIPLNRETIIQLIEESDENPITEPNDEFKLDENGKLFSIDWSVFKNEKITSNPISNSGSTNLESTTSTSQIPSVFNYNPSSTSNTVRPNSKTYEVLLRNSVSFQNTLDRSSSVYNREEEIKRSNGSYLSISRYLLKDLQSRYYGQFFKLSESLGYQISTSSDDSFSFEFQKAENLSSSNSDLNLLAEIFTSINLNRPSLEIKSETLRPFKRLIFKKNGVNTNTDWHLLSWLNDFINEIFEFKIFQMKVLKSCIQDLEISIESTSLTSTLASSIPSNQNQQSSLNLLNSLNQQFSNILSSYEELENFSKDELNLKGIKAKENRNYKKVKRRNKIRNEIQEKSELERKKSEDEEKIKMEKLKDRERKKLIREIEERNKGDEERNDEEWVDEVELEEKKVGAERERLDRIVTN